MEKLDYEILQDIRNQMYRCIGLAVQFVSLVSEFGNVYNPECRKILKELMCTMIMEGEAQRVLDFLSVPVRFALGEEADKVLSDTKEVLEGMDVSMEDRILSSLFNK